MPSTNAVLLDRAVDHAIDELRFERGVVYRMIAVLNRADARLSAQLAEALLQLDAESFTVQRLEALLVSVRETNAAAYAAVFDALEPALRDLAEAEAQAQAAQLRAAVPPAVQLRFPIAGVSVEQVYAAALSRPFQGRLLREWAADLAESRLRQVREAVRAGYVAGETTADIIRKVRGTKALRYEDGILARPRRELATVVQTALSHTAQTARSVSYAANADIIKALRWVSTLDSRTSPQCFPESTLALPVGDLRGVFRREWNGDLIVVTTASGKKLRATPNHPVLTARGWRAIEKIEPGCDVLYRVGRDVGGVTASEDVEVPATMGALFDALSEPSFGHVTTERSAEVDFHGDGMSGDHEIHYADTEGNLRPALESAFGKKGAEKFLVFVAGSAGLSDLGKMDEFGLGSGLVNVATEIYSGAIEHRVKAGFADIELPAQVGGVRAGLECADDGLLIGSPRVISAAKGGHDAGTLEYPCDCGGGDAKITADGGCGLPVGVVADDVVSVEREFFSGHVCNLATGSELYIADGFVVHNCRVRDGLLYSADGKHRPVGGHKVPWGAGPGRLHFNCRSVSVPVLKSWKELGIDAEELPASTRASMDGTVPADLTYGQWLARQSAERQDEILGPVRGKLLRAGRVKVEQFTDDKGNWLTLDQLRAKIGT